MTPYLVEHNGQCCVCVEDADYNAPRIVGNYYPIGSTAHQVRRFFEVETLDAIAVQRTPLSGEFVLVHDRGLRMGETRCNVTLVNGGKTTPVGGHTREFAAPKSRIPVEYSHGRWERHGKRGREVLIGETWVKG